MSAKVFGALLERIIRGDPITADEITDLSLFVGSADSTEAQRAALVMALGIWYKRRTN